MYRFKNLLLVSQGLGNDLEAFKQAIGFAVENKASLKILTIYPGLPESLNDYVKSYESFLTEQAKSVLNSAVSALKLGDLQPDGFITFEVEGGHAPDVRIIQEVLRHGHDLVVKQAESENGSQGYMAIDMELLRKCPCPVWLCRPVNNEPRLLKVAVAIDPYSDEPASRDLAIKLLEISNVLTQRRQGELSIISAWEYEFEHYQIFSQIPEEEMRQRVTQESNAHLKALMEIIQASGISVEYRLHHVRGRPEKVIPAFINETNVDILVMGTVARTGIPGFIIGNTAENVLRKVRCSLLAMKPGGFVSPVKAYD